MVLLFRGSMKRARHEAGDMKDHIIDMGNQTRLCPINSIHHVRCYKVMLARSADFLLDIISITCDVTLRERYQKELCRESLL
jgi:hypothetical protein